MNTMKIRLSPLWIVLGMPFYPLSVSAAEVKEHATNNQNQIGMELVLLKDLLLKGVKLDLKASAPDYFVLVAPPGIGGPEIFDLGSLPAGTRIRVVGLIEKKRLVRSVREYEVAILSPSKAGKSLVRVSSSYAFRLYQKGVTPQVVPRLSAEYFAMPAAPKEKSEEGSTKVRGLTPKPA